MIVSNIRLDIPNSRISKLAQRVNGDSWMTRKQVRDWVEEMVNEFIDGSEEAEPGTDEAADEVAEDIPKADGDRSVRGFVPSRGDEDYLTQPKIPGISAACSRILDDTAIIEKLTWEAIEANRK